MDHGAYRELAAGAALDDLDPRERAALDAHLSACPPCRTDARDLVDTAGLLALAVPSREPPASLRGAVLAAVAASEDRPFGVPAASLAYAGGAPALARPDAPAGRATTDHGAGDTAPAQVVDLDALRRERTRYRRLSFAGLAVAAALTIAVGGLGAAAAGLSTQLDETARERDAAVAQLATNDAAMSVVLAPDHATATLAPEPMAAGAVVYVVYRPGTSEAWMMAADLPASPAGTVYQLWSADAAGVHALTTFTCDGRSACLAPFGVDLAPATATMITLEPAGGAQGEPGPQIAFGELHG